MTGIKPISTPDALNVLLNGHADVSNTDQTRASIVAHAVLEGQKYELDTAAVQALIDGLKSSFPDRRELKQALQALHAMLGSASTDGSVQLRDQEAAKQLTQFAQQQGLRLVFAHAGQAAQQHGEGSLTPVEQKLQEILSGGANRKDNDYEYRSGYQPDVVYAQQTRLDPTETRAVIREMTAAFPSRETLQEAIRALHARTVSADAIGGVQLSTQEAARAMNEFARKNGVALQFDRGSALPPHPVG